jgi:hypothetical protein
MMRQLRREHPRYVHKYTDQHGRLRYYFRRRGSAKVPLPGLPWTPEFMVAYNTALVGAALPLPSTLLGGVKAKRGIDPNTVQPLIGVYLLMLKGKIVYIGSSLNMPNRVAGHRTNGRPFDQVFYIATMANQREALERTLIKAINPAQNRAHRSVVATRKSNEGNPDNAQA